MSDTVEVKEQGKTKYFYNAIDVVTRFAFSLYYKELNSKNMVDFYEEFKIDISLQNKEAAKRQ
jgi:hypothetical protein